MQSRRFQFRGAAAEPLPGPEAIFSLPAKSTALVINPHDDDGALAFGLTIQVLLEAGVDVQVVTTTDGRQGYCQPGQRDSIRAIRRAETITGYGKLGVAEANVHFLDYPCSNLVPAQGRRRQREGDDGHVVEGHFGLQNSYTWLLRTYRPAVVLIPHQADYHPDHQLVYNEFRIAIFHALGNIWPELGSPIERIPLLVEGAIYCAFPGVPDVGVTATDPTAFEAKLAAIEAWVSQTQIVELVVRIRRAGPYEYLRRVPFELYEPEKLAARFGF